MQQRTSRLAVAIAAAMVLVATGCRAPADQARWDVEGLAVGRTLSAASPGPVPDTVADHDLTVRSDSTAAVTVVPGASGQGVALDFPSTGYTAVTAARPEGLSPHDRDFEVSAWVSVRTIDIGSLGSNLMQQGTYYQDQWKMEVDGGRAGCRFADGDVRSGAHAALVRSPNRIDDGSWWILTCRKTANQVAVVVERVGGSGPQTTALASQVGSIDSTKPVMVGSKGIPSDADQFRGLLDNLVVRFP